MKYQTIVADPPWRVHQPPKWNYGQPGGEANRPLPYKTLSVAEIAALPVADFAAEHSHLYLWTINRYIEQAYEIVRAWDFSPSTLITWCKPRKGLGVGGAYALTTEHVLLARRGKEIATARGESTWWRWPRGEHSQKPDAFLDLVESVSPGPYLELFARRQRLGWDTWGNEALEHVEMATR